MVDLVLLALAVCILGILLVGRYTFNPELTEFEERVIREAHLQRQEAHAADRRKQRTQQIQALGIQNAAQN